jgi:hypothetical protein
MNQSLDHVEGQYYEVMQVTKNCLPCVSLIRMCSQCPSQMVDQISLYTL